MRKSFFEILCDGRRLRQGKITVHQCWHPLSLREGRIALITVFASVEINLCEFELDAFLTQRYKCRHRIRTGELSIDVKTQWGVIDRATSLQEAKTIRGARLEIKFINFMAAFF